MNRFRIRGKAAATMAVVGLLISALVPATVAAAAPPVTLRVYMSDKCVSGQASSDSTVELNWKDAYGETKLHMNLETDGDGAFGICVISNWVRVHMGDWISAKDLETGVSHVLIVPRLTGFGNRDLDLYKGTGPAGDSVKLFCAFSNGFEPCQGSWRVRVNSQNKWSFKPGWNVGGGETMIVQWRSTGGDVVRLIATPPYLVVRIGSSRIRGETRNASHLIVVLKRGNTLDVKATAELVADEVNGSFAGPLRNTSGNKVNVKPGDWITSDMSSEIDWIVPNITASANSSTGHITGDCVVGSTVSVSIYRNGEAISGDRQWPGESSFDFNPENSDITFQAGDKVLVACEVAAGDWVERMFTAI